MEQKEFYELKALDLFKDKLAFLVCDSAFDMLDIQLPFSYIRFSEFESNPDDRDAQLAANLFLNHTCDFILAIGGGSSMDMAKAVKFYSNTNKPIVAVPTTSGTGSEATHFAVVYKEGVKQSIAHMNLLPEYVVLDADLLKTVPLYQKKSTMLDALCQAIESWWSKRATIQSIDCSRRAIQLILENMENYLANEDCGNKNMLMAANLAGKAINITTTTAPHAMSYKLTTLYGIAHGHAVALCLPKVWRHIDAYEEIAQAMGTETVREAILYLEDLLSSLGLTIPSEANASDLIVLRDSVNSQRLSNHPVHIPEDEILALYKEILEV